MLEKLDNKNLLLASASPRRKQILELLNLKFSVLIPENSDSKETLLQAKLELNESEDFKTYMKRYVLSLAEAKAQSALESINLSKEDILITADTIVVCDEKIYPKPKDNEHAKSMLKELSGKTHEVLTAVTLSSLDKSISFIEMTEVEFYPLDETQEELIDTYVEAGMSNGKAAAYGIQDFGLSFIKKINGDYYNVMGLPAARLLCEMLEF